MVGLENHTHESIKSDMILKAVLNIMNGSMIDNSN